MAQFKCPTCGQTFRFGMALEAHRAFMRRTTSNKGH